MLISFPQFIQQPRVETRAPRRNLRCRKFDGPLFVIGVRHTIAILAQLLPGAGLVEQPRLKGTARMADA